MSSCELCGAGDFELMAYPQTKTNASLPLREIRICKNCHFAKALPDFSQDVLDKFYDHGEYWSDMKKDKSLEYYYLSQSIHRVQKALAHSGKDQIDVLDVGAGSGKILEALTYSKKSFRYYFVEPDEKKASELSMKQHSLRIGSLNEPGKQYDIIFLNHVLEHTSDPIAFTGTLYRMLRPEGVLYIEVPNQDYKFKQDVFPHTLFFTESSLNKVLEKCSLKVLESSTFGESRTSSLSYKILAKLNQMAALINQFQLSHILTGRMFKFERHNSDGIWLYAISRKEAGN